ncbi:MAG: 2-C-methyl-D-erythritol 2,4-cyclodiphosphate synthase [Crocinitomicaceae bacterium]|nr:2-C-methyl-D-erythritol 2,4-cyclodiphosphate synthase [Crocinitomicaceae bacterium]|tara:strand:+ start:3673 stop:4152 length:480 start_codon:yes stop_codon:yes gene_type:complete
MDFRIGYGYDVHRLSEGEELWIGGILVPGEFGAVGHSDADVLLHVICDAMLGALALGDLGKHFPDTDPAYKGIDSKKLLAHTMELVREKGWTVGNIDTTVCLQAPKLAPYISKMRLAISEVLDCHLDRISVKATTTENIGFIGTGEGISAHAVALLKKG